LACPHYLRTESRCQLLDSLASPPDEEEEELTPAEDVKLSLCCAPGSDYKHCPIYRQYLAERRP
jgi:hypothetical protein